MGKAREGTNRTGKCHELQGERGVREKISKWAATLGALMQVVRGCIAGGIDVRRHGWWVKDFTVTKEESSAQARDRLHKSHREQTPYTLIGRLNEILSRVWLIRYIHHSNGSAERRNIIANPSLSDHQHVRSARDPAG